MKGHRVSMKGPKVSMSVDEGPRGVHGADINPVPAPITEKKPRDSNDLCQEFRRLAR